MARDGLHYTQVRGRTDALCQSFKNATPGSVPPFCSLYSNTREPQTPSGRWGTLVGVYPSGYDGCNLQRKRKGLHDRDLARTCGKAAAKGRPRLAPRGYGHRPRRRCEDRRRPFPGHRGPLLRGGRQPAHHCRALQGGGRHTPARRRVQATHLSLRPSGHGRARARPLARGTRPNGHADRERGHGHTRRGAVRESWYRCHADRGAKRTELRAAQGSRPHKDPGPTQARHGKHARRAAHGRRIHHERGQRASHPVRARHPHVRDGHAQHL